jgi:ankyrin repeat protein
MTALHRATHQGHLEMVRLLLEKGADTDLLNQVSAVCAVHVGYGGGNLPAALLPVYWCIWE